MSSIEFDGAVKSIAELPLTLTVDEAAAALRISRGSAFAAVKAGGIPSIRLGRRIIVPRAALERLLAGEQDS